MNASRSSNKRKSEKSSSIRVIKGVVKASVASTLVEAVKSKTQLKSWKEILQEHPKPLSGSE
jgi:hypothetical protein